MNSDLKEEFFNNINAHILNDEAPSKYFNEISSSEVFKEYPFNLIYKLKDANQSPKHHPEGNVWNHTMMVLDNAAKLKSKSKDPKVFMWAALLHDIGKPSTTRLKKGRITSYGHDVEGAVLAGKFLEEFTDDKEFINEVVTLVRWHMHILFVVKDLPFGDVDALVKEADIEEVALLGMCDRLGRLGVKREEEEENISVFIKKCKENL